MVEHAFNARAEEAEVGDEELEVNLGYTVRPCLKRKCGKGGRKRRGGKEEKERS